VNLCIDFFKQSAKEFPGIKFITQILVVLVDMGPQNLSEFIDCAEECLSVIDEAHCHDVFQFVENTAI
jgi:hypothetical protein